MISVEVDGKVMVLRDEAALAHSGWMSTLISDGRSASFVHSGALRSMKAGDTD